jgi:hypothetical protein
MRTEYNAQTIAASFAEMEDDDFHFVSESGGIDLEGMREMAVYLVKLSVALCFMEDIQTFLDAVDEPTLDQANDKAFGMMNAFIVEQPFE